MSCLQNFTTKEMLNNYRERCLLINDTQAVKYETETIKFKNFNKQIPAPFKVYADTECSFKRVNINKGGYTKLYQKHETNAIAAKISSNNCVKEFIEWVFEREKYCNQTINKHFNKKLKMTIEDEENFQNSLNCWICDQKIN